MFYLRSSPRCLSPSLNTDPIKCKLPWNPSLVELWWLQRHIAHSQWRTLLKRHQVSLVFTSTFPTNPFTSIQMRVNVEDWNTSSSQFPCIPVQLYNETSYAQCILTSALTTFLHFLSVDRIHQPSYQSYCKKNPLILHWADLSWFTFHYWLYLV